MKIELKIPVPTYIFKLHFKIRLKNANYKITEKY